MSRGHKMIKRILQNQHHTVITDLKGKPIPWKEGLLPSEEQMSLEAIDNELYDGKVRTLEEKEKLTKADLAIFLTEDEELIRRLAKKKFEEQECK